MKAKGHILIAFVFLLPVASVAQQDSASNNYSWGAYSGFYGHFYKRLTLNLGAEFYNPKLSFSLSPSLALDDFGDNTLRGGTFRTKVYPNKRSKILSFFFSGTLDYFRLKRSHGVDYHEEYTLKKSFALHIGYGFDVRLFEDLFVSTGIGFGPLLYHFESRFENANSPGTYSMTKYGFYKEVEFSYQVNLTLGYRFNAASE